MGLRIVCHGLRLCQQSKASSCHSLPVFIGHYIHTKFPTWTLLSWSPVKTQSSDCSSHIGNVLCYLFHQQSPSCTFLHQSSQGQRVRVTRHDAFTSVLSLSFSLPQFSLPQGQKPCGATQFSFCSCLVSDKWGHYTWVLW